MDKIFLKGLDEVIYHDVTDEGMHIYMWPEEKKKSFYMTLNVKYGSIHTEFKPKESKEYIKVPNGIAHFLEHLMFYQPDGTSAHEYFTKLGSSINACTTTDFTFYEVFSSNHFKENLNYLLDYVNTPFYTKENVKTECGIITEEIKMYDDNPSAQIIYKTHECLWQKNKRKYLVSGTVEDIKEITVDDLYTVYDNFYHPSNMFMVITGNFNPYEAVAIIKENLSKKEFKEYDKPVLKEEREPNKVALSTYEEENNVQIPKIRVSVKLPLSTFKNYRKDELRLYLNILLKSNFGLTSDLHEKLFENNIITNPLTYGTSIYETHLTITIGAKTNYPEEVIKNINETLNNMKVSSEELNRRKKAYVSSLVLTYDDIEDVNMLIQDDLIVEDKIIDDVFPLINSLNIEDLNIILNKLNFNNKVTVVFKPKDEESS